MSIAGALAAERAEKERIYWLYKLELAYEERSWERIEELIEEIRNFRFEE